MDSLATTINNTFIPSLVAAVTILLVFFVKSKINQKNEQKNTIWKEELPQLRNLQKLSGELVEFVPTCFPELPFTSEIIEKLSELRTYAGEFRKHQDLKESINNLHHSLILNIDLRRRERDVFENEKNIEQHYQELIRLSDKLINK